MSDKLKKELTLLIRQNEKTKKTDPENALCIDIKNYKRAFLQILKEFDKEGASGGSAPYQINALTRIEDENRKREREEARREHEARQDRHMFPMR